MGEYNKKLHIRKGGKVDDITLYTNASDLPGGALALRDGNTVVYAGLGDVSDTNASRLRVRKNDIVYSVALKIGYSNSMVIKLNSHVHNIDIPSNVKKIKFTVYDDGSGERESSEYSISNPRTAGAKLTTKGGGSGVYIYEVYFYINGEGVGKRSYCSINDIYCLIEW